MLSAIWKVCTLLLLLLGMLKADLVVSIYYMWNHTSLDYPDIYRMSTTLQLMFLSLFIVVSIFLGVDYFRYARSIDEKKAREGEETSKEA